MQEVKDIPLDKVKHVLVHYKGEKSPVTYTGFDSGEGAWKKENGQLWVHQIDLLGAPNRSREPYWVAVAKIETVDDIDTKPPLG
jgi:hypothetical protein